MGNVPAIRAKPAQAQVASRFCRDHTSMQFRHDHIFETDVVEALRRIGMITCLVLREKIDAVWVCLV